MTGTLKAQLAQYGMSERLPEVLEEVVRVREEFGHPIFATPFSQLIGIQSCSTSSPATGTPSPPTTSPHGKQFAGWTRPQPSLNELREQYGGRSISDEELLLRYMVPAEDVEAVRAAGPLRTDYDFTDVHSLPQLVAHLQGLQRTRSVSVSGPDYRFAFHRG